MNKLPAGHSLTWREGRLSVQRYWTPAPRPIAASSKRPGANSREFRELFDEAVRLRFRSDVPVGLFLSGGLDSSMVAVSAVEQGFRPQAFTVAFDAEDIDFPFAEKVARHLHLEHHLIRVTASGAIEDTSRLFHHYDEPFADSSSIPSFQIARATQGHVKVVLNGDAGDEAFAGYGYYKAAAFTFRKRQFASVLGLRDSNPCDPFEVVAAGRLAFPQRERRRLLNGVNPDDGLKAFLRTDSYLSEARKIRLSALRRFMWFDRHVYLPNDLMYKMDIALSAFGIEGRSPFMDHRLMDWAQGLPHGHLVYHGKTKIMLKAALEGRLPRDIVQRQKKGFGSPMRRWLQGELAAPMRDALSSGFFSRLCDRGLPLALANRALARDHALPAWTLFAFELWAQHWKPSL
jgi:asparagine synthase (glutamine-hydrolysing)